jgi:hypothetical protein
MLLQLIGLFTFVTVAAILLLRYMSALEAIVLCCLLLAALFAAGYVTWPSHLRDSELMRALTYVGAGTFYDKTKTPLDAGFSRSLIIRMLANELLAEQLNASCRSEQSGESEDQVVGFRVASRARVGNAGSRHARIRDAGTRSGD